MAPEIVVFGIPIPESFQAKQSDDVEIPIHCWSSEAPSSRRLRIHDPSLHHTAPTRCLSTVFLSFRCVISFVVHTGSLTFTLSTITQSSFVNNSSSTSAFPTLPPFPVEALPEPRNCLRCHNDRVSNRSLRSQALEKPLNATKSIVTAAIFRPTTSISRAAMPTLKMHRPTTLVLLALLLRTTCAFVPFAYSLHPNIDMATISLPSQPAETTYYPPTPASPSLQDPIPTNLAPTQEEDDAHDDLRKRQGAPVTAAAPTNPVAPAVPPAAAPTAAATVPAADPGQISPVTIYEIDQIPPGGGAPVKVQIAYTQTFAAVPEQWPVPGQGEIGMGTIRGEVGHVRTKRFVPFMVEVATRTVSFRA